MSDAARGRSRPPLPAPLRLWRVLPGLAAGIAGTSLMYQAATGGTLARLALGVAAFALGLGLAGYPFVLATAWRRRARDRARRAVPRTTAAPP